MPVRRSLLVERSCGAPTYSAQTQPSNIRLGAHRRYTLEEDLERYVSQRTATIGSSQASSNTALKDVLCVGSPQAGASVASADAHDAPPARRGRSSRSASATARPLARRQAARPRHPSVHRRRGPGSIRRLPCTAAARSRTRHRVRTRQSICRGRRCRRRIARFSLPSSRSSTGMRLKRRQRARVRARTGSLDGMGKKRTGPFSACRTPGVALRCGACATRWSTSKRADADAGPHELAGGSRWVCWTAAAKVICR